MIYVVPFGHKIPDYATVINTTSSSKNWSRGLSPFFVGPCKLYRDYTAKNAENAWQFSKVYGSELENDGSVGEKYFSWAQKGWNDSYAHRYPKGRGAIPLFSYWNGECLDYIAARKKIYIPLYSEAVQKTKAFKELKSIYEVDKSADLYLQDFDAFNNRALDWSWEQVINNPDKKMGHAFVLAMLLEGYII